MRLRTRVVGWFPENQKLLVICLATVVIMAGQGITTPVLPLFAKNFGVSVTMVGLSISAFGLARLLLNVPAGLVADRFGRRPLLVGGPIVYSLAMFGSAVSPNIWILLVSRFFVGAGSALYMTGTQIYLADISTEATRARYIATNQGALFVGVSIGPAVGGLSAELFGLRSPFLLVGTMSIGAALHAWLRLPETRPVRVAGLVPECRSVPEGRGSAVAPEAPGREQPSKSPETPARFFWSPNFVCISLVCLGMFLMRAAGQQSLMALYGTDKLHLSAGALGAIFTVLSLITLISLPPTTYIADRFGRKAAIVPAGLLAGMGLILVSVAQSSAFFLMSACVFGVGMGLGAPTPAAYAVDITPPGARGLALGIFRSVGDFGVVAGPLAMGAVADWTSLSTALVVTALIVVAIVALFALVATETMRKPLGPDIAVGARADVTTKGSADASPA